MLLIALTGGIGSGKTLVGHMFQTLGIPVYVADNEAKRLMYRDKALKLKIKSLLGRGAYHRNGRLNRQFVSKKIFNDKKLLDKINQIVHPAVQNDFRRWASIQQAPYVIEESALIYEIKAQSRFDKVILVSAEKELRIKRVMARDGVTRNQVLNRMKKQLDEKAKINLANFVIKNNGIESLIQQVYSIHNKLLKIKN